VTSPTSDRDWIAPERPDLVWFHGADALRFLDDLISQELEDMAIGETRRSFLLEPQGKLRFLLWVLREDDRLGLLTDSGRGAELAEALGRYRIRVDVEIEPEPGGVWIVMGPWEGYDVSWAAMNRHLVVGDRPDLDEGLLDEYERLRILSGEPRWGVDVDGDTIPHESGLVTVSVDFEKGCFLGQELVARMDSRGANPPRSLRLLETDGPIAAGDVVSVEGVEVGMVTSATEGAGLAMLKRTVSVGDSVDVGGRRAIVRELPIRSNPQFTVS
jgi:folate-binding protein YgfZ